MKAKRVWTVCLAVLTLLALLAGCGKQAQVQSDPSPEPDPEPALFDGSFDLVLKSEYQGDLPEVNFRLATDEDGKRYFFSGGFTEPHRKVDDITPLVYGKQYSMTITNLEALTGVADQPGFQGIWAIFKAGGQECGRVFIPEDQLHGGTVRVVKLHGAGAVRRRIMDMGITRGVEVHVRKVAPLGDPIEVTVRGYQLSLRKGDAEMIEVE